MANDIVWNILANDKASKNLEHVGDVAEQTGKRVAKIGEETEKGSARGRKALGLLTSTFVSSSAGALGPLQEIADKFEVIDRASEVATSKTGARLIGIGAAATGVGAFLSTLASRDQEAQQRLQAAIEATGHSYEEYAAGIEKAVKSGEHFGNQAPTTLDALNRLTITTHSEKEALEALPVAIDVAAAKHISLSKAAEIVGLTFNGSTRAGKQFGLHLVDTKKATQELDAAQKNLATATDKVTSTQQAYTDKLAIYNQTVKPTLAQQIALFRSHQALVDAQDKDRAAKERLTQAQKKATEATHAGADNVAKLAAVVHGQGEASADSFRGRLKALGAQIEDVGASLGKDFGGAITAIGPVIFGFGLLVESGMIGKLLRLIGISRKTGAAVKAMGVAEAEGAAIGAAGIELSAAAGEEAMLAEAATAEKAAGRIRAALAGIGLGGVGVAGALGIGSVLLTSGDSPQVASGDIQKLLYGIEDKAHAAGADKGAFLGAYKAALAPGYKDGTRVSGNIDKTAALNFLLKYADGSSPEVASALKSLGYTPPPLATLSQQRKAQLTSDLHSDDPKVVARARAALAAHANAPSSHAPATESLASFLSGIGGGSVANAKDAAAAAAGRKSAKSAAAAAKSAAAASAKAAIKAYQEVLRAKISTDDAKIKSEQRVIDATNKQIGALKTQQQVYIDYAKSITDKVKSLDSITGFGTKTDGQNAGDLAYLLAERVEENKIFGSTLSSLGKGGLNKTLLDQIAQGGPDQTSLLAALQNATPDQIKALNAQQAILDQQAGSIGQSALLNQYGTEPQKTNAALLAANKIHLQQLAEQKKTTNEITLLRTELASVGHAVTGTAGTAATRANGRPRG